MKIGIIGVGKMGCAIIDSLLSIYSADSIFITDIDKDKASEVGEKRKVIFTDIKGISKKCNIIIIAVKPQDFQNLNLVTDSIIVSIMAGVKIDRISRITGSSKVIRVMPNLCSSVGESCSGFASSSKISDKEKASVKKILDSFGASFEVKEEMLDAVTGLSGSGPAYVAYLIDAFAKAAEKQGFSKKQAQEMSIQTFYGTAKLLKQKNILPLELIQSVSSKGGTTVAGMSVLESSDIDEVLASTVDKATKRSRELGK